MSTAHLKTAAAAAVKDTNPAVEILLHAQTRMTTILPKHLTPERMSALALGCLRTNDYLRTCAMANPDSFLSAVLMSCRMGLEPGIDAHLVPYKSPKAKLAEIQCIPDYRGLIKLARQSGEVDDIYCHVVYENDEFDLSLGLDVDIRHKPRIIGDRGAPVLVYAVAKLSNGQHHVEWMSIESINAIRDNSPAYIYAKSNGIKRTPWIAEEDEMRRKTALRRLCKYIPRSIALTVAQTALDAEQAGRKVKYDPDSDVASMQDDETSPFPEIIVEPTEDPGAAKV